MNPYVLAFITIAPLSFLAGFIIRPFIAPGASSTPQGQPLTLKDIAMAVYAELVQPLADLDAAVAALPDKIAGLGNPQDKADTLAAVETSVKSATDAINAVGQ